MDLETFYHSDIKKWVLVTVGLISIFFGLLNIIFFVHSLYHPQNILFFIPVLSAFSVMMIGIILILVGHDKKKAALFLLAFMLIFSLIHMFIFLAVKDLPIYERLTHIIIPLQPEDLALKAGVTAFIFLLIEVALLSYSLATFKQWPLWFGGICGAIALGLSIYFTTFSFTHLAFTRFASMKIAGFGPYLTALLALTTLFYGSIRFAFFHHKNFVWWLPTFATITTLFLVLTTWSAINAREKQIILKDNRDNLGLLKYQIESRTTFYFDILQRIANRLKIYNVSQLSNVHWMTEKEIFSSFRWLDEFGLVESSRKIVELRQEGRKGSLLPLYSLINDFEKEELQKYLPCVFFIKGEEEKQKMIAFLPFDSPTAASKVYFYAIADANGYFADSIGEFLTDNSAIVISTTLGKVYESQSHDTEFKEPYQATTNLDFHGSQLKLILWPLAKALHYGYSFASYYQLFTGLIFALTLFGALYAGQYALNKKREADKANKEKTMFLANMSHEIRTPLHGIIGSCSLLELTEMDNYQKKWVSGISKSGKMLLELVDDLLDLSKIETATLKLEPRSLNLKNLLFDLVTLFTPEAQAKNLTLHLHYAPELTEHYMLDGRRIRQILANLVQNGIKYTERGEVNITVFEDIDELGKNLVFKIADTGVGMSPAKIDNIFTKYLAIDIRAEHGTGLGLALVKRLVGLMEGKIEVASELGRGTTFTVKIPLNVEERGEN